jgi:hypothetical protein
LPVPGSQLSGFNQLGTVDSELGTFFHYLLATETEALLDKVLNFSAACAGNQQNAGVSLPPFLRKENSQPRKCLNIQCFRADKYFRERGQYWHASCSKYYRSCT